VKTTSDATPVATATCAGANAAVIPPVSRPATVPAAAETSTANAIPSRRASVRWACRRTSAASGSGTRACATIPTIPTSICAAAYCVYCSVGSRWAMSSVHT
jgi:hypothetical protein